MAWRQVSRHAGLTALEGYPDFGAAALLNARKEPPSSTVSWIAEKVALRDVSLAQLDLGKRREAVLMDVTPTASSGKTAYQAS